MVETFVSLKDLFEEAKWRNRKKKPYNPKYNKINRRYRTGFKNVTKVFCPSCKDNYIFMYGYFDGNGEYQIFNSVDLVRLKEKTLSKGLEWKIEDYDCARETCKKIGLTFNDIL